MSQSNIEYIMHIADTQFSEIGITKSDLDNIQNKLWIQLLGEYVCTRGYAKTYYKIIFTAIKEGTIGLIDPMSVLSGELQEEYNRVKSLTNEQMNK